MGVVVLPVCRYGLAHASAAPQAVQGYDASARAAETRQRLEEAARRKEAEERDKAAQRYQRKQHRPGQISGAQLLSTVFNFLQCVVHRLMACLYCVDYAIPVTCWYERLPPHPIVGEQSRMVCWS